jgi:hypothetical protein
LKAASIILSMNQPHYSIASLHDELSKEQEVALREVYGDDALFESVREARLSANDVLADWKREEEVEARASRFYDRIDSE